MKTVDKVAILQHYIDPPLTRGEEIEILRYAARVIQNTPIMKHMYAIADFVQPILERCTNIVDSTPANIISIVNKRFLDKNKNKNIKRINYIHNYT